MASVSFLVRTASSKADKAVTIRARLKAEGGEAYAKTHLSLPAKYWNPKGKTPRAKIRDRGEFTDREFYKSELEKLQGHILFEYQQGGQVTSEWLNNCIANYINPHKDQAPVTMFEYIERFIKRSENAINPKTGNPISLRIRRDYLTTFTHLKNFAGKREIDFNDIDLDFYGSFVNYLQTVPKVNGKAYKANTVGKFIKNLKTFMNKATEEGINTNLRYKANGFTKIQIDSDNIYLNETELDLIQKLDLTNRPALERVRDLFIVGCWTGLRFGDLSRIRPENIKDNLIHTTQSKTGDRVVIPLHSVVSNILKKYGGALPGAISNQKTNEALKTIAEMAGIKGTERISEIRGGIKQVVKKERHQLVSTHTARRSFATNLYKSGFPSQSIMRITGHKSEGAFLKYIKVTPEEHAHLLQKHWNNLTTI